MTPNAEEYQIEKSKRDLAKLKEILSSKKTIKTLVQDILAHYKETRAQILTGKAMIVAYSRPIAIKI